MTCGPITCIRFGLAVAEIQVVLTRLLRRSSLRLEEPEREVRGTGIASMFPEHGVKVVVDDVRP